MQGSIFAGNTLIVKFAGCMLAVGSGLPSGPEAPMIHLGAMVGRTVSAPDSFLASIGEKVHRPSVSEPRPSLPQL